ncbi:MAG: protein kinase [Calditrichaeota bacterium]|nr:protein kinase [Calditrichota bacterium]
MYFSPHIPFENSEFAFSISPLSEKSIWYGTNLGVFHFDGDSTKKHLDKSVFAKKNLEMLNVVALNDSNVWAVAIEPENWEKRMFFYNGEKWQRQAFPQYDDDPTDDLAIFRLDIVEDQNEIIGYVAGQGGLIYVYKNQSWEIVEPFAKNTFRALHIQNKNSVWIGGSAGAIYHFNGQSWLKSQTKNVDSTNYILDIDFISDANGWAVGSKEIWHFDGLSWSTVDKPKSSYLRDVEMISGSEGWAMSHDGEVLYYDGIDWALYDKIASTIHSTQIGLKWTGNEFGQKIFIAGTQGIYLSNYGNLPTFRDITEFANIHKTKGTPIVADFDQNATLDLLVSGFMDEPLRLYSNTGDGFFSEVTEKLDQDLTFNTKSIQVADLDNNGLPDIYLSRSPQSDIWFQNKGNWQFEERKSPISSSQKSVRSKVFFADFDNSGSLDLLHLKSYQMGHDSVMVIYINDGVANFKEAVRFGKSDSKSSATGWIFLRDFNNDGLIDIYKVNLAERFQLYINRDNLVFEEVAAISGLDALDLSRAPYVSGVDAADLNNDGILDISIVERHGKTGIFLSDSTLNYSLSYTFNNNFVDIKAAAFADFDCDGLEDFYFYDRLYLNNGNHLVESPPAIGYLPIGNPYAVDIDLDSDPDLLLRGTEKLSVYKNTFNPTNSLQVTLKGVRSNSFAIGTQLKLWRVNNEKSTLQNYKQVYDSNPLNFYLDKTNEYNLEVIFPSGIRRLFNNVKSGPLQINEFPFFFNAFWDFYYSFKRSLQLTSVKNELLKLLMLVIMSVLFFLLIRNTKAVKYLNHAYSLFLFVFAYLVLMHVSVRESFFVSFLTPVMGIFILQVLLFYFIRQRLSHLEVNYVSHFRLQQPIGMGGMGMVYKAFDVHSKKIMAVKIINKLISEDDNNRGRLLAEGQIMTQLSHPNIVKVQEMGKTENKDFIVMEYLENGTLKNFINEHKPIAEQEIVRIVKQVIDGLQAIHDSNIVHRDLTSFNIMLDGSKNMRIMDFGLSKSPLITSMTTLGTAVGTLGYTAPEQITGGKVDQRSDIFSLGVIIYELLTSKLPFTGENEMALIHSIFNVTPQVPSKLRADIHPFWDRIVSKCMIKDINERPESVVEIGHELDAVFTEIDS